MGFGMIRGEEGFWCMSLLVQCPFCSAQVKVSDSAAMTTCPKCLKSFNADFPKTAVTARVAKREARAVVDDSEEEDSAPSRINPWGAGAFILATLALLAAT